MWREVFDICFVSNVCATSITTIRNILPGDKILTTTMDEEPAAPSNGSSIPETYKQTAFEIIETLQSLSMDTGPLEKIIIMLATNLTFDDPGVVWDKIVADPEFRAMQLAFNLWLNNQVTSIYSNTENERYDIFYVHLFLAFNIICVF